MATDDTDDLEALFDSIAGSVSPAPEPATPAQAESPAAVTGDLYSQAGQLARRLHDTLSEIGHDRAGQLHTAAEQASSKAKTAIDTIDMLQESIESEASQLSAKWQQLLDGKLSVDEFKVLATETRAYLQDVPAKAKTSIEQLANIGGAQDAQPIKKLADVALFLEGQLLQALVANAPETKKKELSGNITTPDQIKATLGSLGF